MIISCSLGGDMDVFWGIFLITQAKSLGEGLLLNVCFLSQFSRCYDTIYTLASIVNCSS